MRIDITIPGTPVGKGRPRVTRFGTYTPPKTKKYEKLIAECWREQSGVKFQDDVPLSFKVFCFFSVPKSFSQKKKRELLGKPHLKKPDVDNCIKSASDGLQGYAFKDDSAICRVEAYKMYSNSPRMRIVLEDIGGDARNEKTGF